MFFRVSLLLSAIFWQLLTIKGNALIQQLDSWYVVEVSGQGFLPCHEMWRSDDDAGETGWSGWSVGNWRFLKRVGAAAGGALSQAVLAVDGGSLVRVKETNFIKFHALLAPGLFLDIDDPEEMSISGIKSSKYGHCCQKTVPQNSS